MARAARIVKTALTVLLLALTIAVALPSFTGRPIVSYASSGSMEPTIGVLDGFLVNPFPSTIEPGDIVVFESVTRGGPAVHRIVALDGNGWITQGDANPRRDQDSGEPTLTRERVLGKVVTDRDGRPIVIEQLGATFLEARARFVVAENAVGGPRQLAALGFFLLALSFAVPALFTRPKRRLPTRIPLRARVALRRLLPRGVLGRHVALALLVVVVASTVVGAANARQVVTASMIVLQDPSAADDTRATGRGGELVRDIPVASLGYFPTVAIIEPDSDAILPIDESVALGPAGEATMKVRQRAGEEVGIQDDAVPVWRYPAILPMSAIVALHDLAPGLPYVALGFMLVAMGGAWFAALRIRTLPVARTLGIREDWL